MQNNLYWWGTRKSEITRVLCNLNVSTGVTATKSQRQCPRKQLPETTQSNKTISAWLLRDPSATSLLTQLLLGSSKSLQEPQVEKI